MWALGRPSPSGSFFPQTILVKTEGFHSAGSARGDRPGEHRSCLLSGSIQIRDGRFQRSGGISSRRSAKREALIQSLPLQTAAEGAKPADGFFFVFCSEWAHARMRPSVPGTRARARKYIGAVRPI